MSLASFWRQTSIPCLTALVLGLCLCSPAAAGARTNTGLQSAVGEEAGSGGLQESTSGSPGTGEAPAESSTTSRNQRREERHQARVERNEERREAHEQLRRERRGPQAEAACAIELQAPRVVVAGASLGVTGTLSCAEAGGAAEQTVTLYQKVAGTPGFALVATSATETAGTFAFSVPSPEGDSVLYVGAGAARSARARVEVAPAVTITAPLAGAQLFAGGAAARAGVRHHGRSASTSTSTLADAVTFTGTVNPANAGTNVALEQQFKDGGWHRIASGHVGEDGSYSIVHVFSKPGETTVRVLVRSHGRYMTSASAPVTYLLLRPQWGPITIQSSSDPLAYGGAVTITGSVAGAADQAVKLLAQTTPGTFTQVAEGVTEGQQFSFTQSPLQSTRYRVVTAAASSTVLPETVTYALTASPSPASLSAGEQLTLAGAVAGADEGQAVYLERESLSHVSGYHVIATGAVSSGSTYSIAYTPHAVGEELLRINVPGSSEIAGVASEPFELEVTPAA